MPTLFKRQRTLLLTIGALFAIAATSLTLYTWNPSFRDAVDDIYSTGYYGVFVDPMMNGVADVRRNVAYCGTDSSFQELDVYTPKHQDRARPAVVYIHGGGWSTGDKANPFVASYGTDIVKHDFAFVSVNYRLAPQSIYPAQNQDVDCALAYIVAHADELRIDVTKIALIGDSAGGQLAAMAALTSPSKSHVRAVVSFYGPADVWVQITRKPRADKWAVNYIGSANNEIRARQASPLYANLAGAPPFLIVHGVNDQTVRYDQAVTFTAKLKAANVDVTLLPVQNANHYFSSKSRPDIGTVTTRVVDFLKQHIE